MIFKELSEQEFKEFSNHFSNNNFWQTPNMAHQRKKRGYPYSYVGVFENNQIIAASMLSFVPIFKSYSCCQILRGPLLDFSNLELFSFFHEQLVLYLKKKNVLYFHMNPYLPYKERNLQGQIVENGFDHSYIFNHLIKLGYQHEGFVTGIDASREPRWMYTIDTENISLEDLLKRMERKTIRSIHHVMDYNIQIHEIDRNHLSIYEDIIKDTTHRRGFEFRESSYYQNVFDSFHEDGYVQFLYATMNVQDYIHSLQKDLKKHQDIVKQSSIRLETQESPKIRRKMNIAMEQVQIFQKKIEDANYIIESDGNNIILAAGLFFTYGQEILCLMSGVYEKYMKFCSPYALHWHMLKECIEKGYKRYNLYGISGIFDESAPDYGVYLFKKGFNGNVIELMGDFEFIVNPKIYALYQTLRKVKHKMRM
ncbi:MAG: peptidoglycan bridge formation glycyltransferase FemA/FemB family protein [Floccifex sp.]